MLIFVLTPPTILTLQVLDHLSARDIEVAKSMSPMYMAVSAVMASLAGLNTWDRRNNGPRNQKPKD